LDFGLGGRVPQGFGDDARRPRKTRILTSEPNFGWHRTFSKKIIIVGFKSCCTLFGGLDKVRHWSLVIGLKWLGARAPGGRRSAARDGKLNERTQIGLALGFFQMDYHHWI
jgi:hypothetical protein